ncbi:MAG TPA: non-canonical purine NTP pyrophosphatase [Microthrixaceae bacterium]|nr:non-canonical purine NTP pyrophosphatase [Microthrixaceae bacterium]
MAEPRVFLASRNRKKLAEMERILAAHVPGVRVLGLDDLADLGVPDYAEPVEDRPDFHGNAALKARAGLRATGLPTLADDSGLCVDALNGMPGVLSARWSGLRKAATGATEVDEANNRLLLAQLEDVPDERRTGHFACAVVLAHLGADGTEQEIAVEGRMPGRLVRAPRGENGFGYDVVFVAEEYVTDGPPDSWLTTAQLDSEAKDAVSHRGRALRAIAPRVAAVLGG